MKTLSIDIETYSSISLKESGLYKYVQSADFEILLFAYAYDNDDVKIIDLAAGEEIPNYVINDLSDFNVVKTAYNAAFEQYALSKLYRTPIEQWHCTMVLGSYRGYPLGLSAIGAALGLEEDKKKMSVGKALIRKFCMPCSPTKTNGGRTRNYYYHEPEQWELFKKYCIQDVVTEREVRNRLLRYVPSKSEHDLWVTDQKINMRGVRIDTELVYGAIQISENTTNALMEEAKVLTGLENPKSIAQLKKWLNDSDEFENEINSLNKADVPKLIKRCGNDTIKRVLEIKQELNKTSVKKYFTMDKALCDDGRVRGLLQFYGASRTGRWAGRLVQVHNLPRNYIETLNLARKFVKEKNAAALKAVYGNIPDTMSQLIRTAFIPKEGCKFVVADFSAIEARVIAWLADEQWRIDVFKTHGKIYEASASQMFGVPIEKIKKGNPEYALRAKGKVAELALGYQGSSPALISMGALDMGLHEEELPDIVRRWRDSNKRIVDTWYTFENAAVTCINYGTPYYHSKGIVFYRDENDFIINLPSGRRLFYSAPHTFINGWGKEQPAFYGVNQSSKKWAEVETYGGKLTENIVQAIARDCLANAIMNLTAVGYEIVMHIHDEVVLEVPRESNFYNLENAIRLMCVNPVWAQGLPLNADGFEGEYYKKE